VNFQSSQAKQKQKFPPKFDKILGCYSHGNRNIWNGPSLWERRARNKKSMILKNNLKVTRQTMIREKQGK
jgi:hypothetical protein